MCEHYISFLLLVFLRFYVPRPGENCEQKIHESFVRRNP